MEKGIAEEVGLILEALENILADYLPIQSNLNYRKLASMYRILKKQSQSQKEIVYE